MIRPACLALALLLATNACAGQENTPVSPIPVATTVLIPLGTFDAGSTTEERELAYRLDETAYGHSRTRDAGWYEREPAFGPVGTGAFEIMENLVTNADYARFIAAADHPPPDVDAATWAGYGLVHPFESTRRFVWVDDQPPAGREDHPVVLVSHADAKAYAAWLSSQQDVLWRVPLEPEWEKAARGTDGRTFPWGDTWDSTRLNSADEGPFDTLPVGSFPNGASPFGLLDPAGQVFEWTATEATDGRYIVKGGSWDDKGCGVCRPAARHARPEDLKHILIGFRLVRQVEEAQDLR